MNHLHVLIMAGGAGTRFWPRSRRAIPKQFLPLTGGASLLETTVERVRQLCPSENIWIATREDLRSSVERLLPLHPRDRIVCEPEGRDTAPCLVLGAARVERVDPEALILVLPSDHVIGDGDRFRRAVEGAVESLDRIDGILTFGIRPTHPATGYGYIQSRQEQGIPAGSCRCFGVESFREKPDLETARRYLEETGYYWNAGIFLWRLATFRQALERWTPELARGWDGLRVLGEDSLRECRADLRTSFAALPRISIDYALLEKADNVRVVAADFDWDDVGSWRAIERYREADAAGNIAEGRALLVDSRRCTVLGEKRVVAVLGVEGLVVVDTPDALLVCPRDRVEEVKRLVDLARERGWEDVV